MHGATGESQHKVGSTPTRGSDLNRQSLRGGRGLTRSPMSARLCQVHTWEIFALGAESTHRRTQDESIREEVI